MCYKTRDEIAEYCSYLKALERNCIMYVCTILFVYLWYAMKGVDMKYTILISLKINSRKSRCIYSMFVYVFFYV